MTDAAETIHTKQLAVQFLARQLYAALQDLHEADPQPWICRLRDVSGKTGASVVASVGTVERLAQAEGLE